MTVSSSIAPTASIPPPRAASLPPPATAVSRASLAPSSPGDATILSWSTPAQLMVKMRQLAVSDPEEFKLLAARMATSFEDAATGATGQDAQLLTRVSTQFQTAAQTGTLEASAASATSDGEARSAASTAPVQGTRHSLDPYARGRLEWEASAVQQAFADAMDLFPASVQSAASG